MELPGVFIATIVNTTQGMRMQTPERFRKYAEECRHLAKSLTGDQRDTLLEIANAWDEFAANAERSGNGGNGKDGSHHVSERSSRDDQQ